MKIFLHRNGTRTAYSNGRLKLRDTVTGRTYWLSTVFWDMGYGNIDNFEQGRIHVYPTEETAREMVAEPGCTQSIGHIMQNSLAEFSERFEPYEIQAGDWFIFEHDGRTKLGQLQDNPSATAEFYRLRVSGDAIYNIPKQDCRFYAVSQVPEEVVNNRSLWTVQVDDIVCLKSDITKVGKVNNLNWRNKLVVVDYFNNSDIIGEFEENELTLLSKERKVGWGSFSGAVEAANNPRVKDGVDGSTHQIYSSIRLNGSLLRNYPYNTNYGIPETINQLVPQLGRTVETKRYRDGDWLIDVTVEDHTTPQGQVEKTWYRAMNTRTANHEKWLMEAMSNHKKVYEAMLQVAVIRTPEVSADEAAETAELQTATQRIEAAAARFRAEADVREAARIQQERERQRVEEANRRAEAARQEELRRQREAEEAKRTIWSYHILKPKVQNP